MSFKYKWPRFFQKSTPPPTPDAQSAAIPSLDESAVERAVSRPDSIPTGAEIAAAGPDGIDGLNLYRAALAMSLAEMQERIRHDAKTDPVAARLERFSLE